MIFIIKILFYNIAACWVKKMQYRAFSRHKICINNQRDSHFPGKALIKHDHNIMPNPYLKYFIARCRSNRGFTLVELMVVMVIVGILATGVVFMFTDPTAKVKAAAFEMRGDLNLARAEAVRRNQNILMDFLFTAEADCSKIDKDSFDACYGAGSNQGYVICFDENGDNDCEDEVRSSPPATAEEVAGDLQEKIIKTVIFTNSVKYYAEIGGTLPSSPTGPTPSIAPVGGTLASNNGITFGDDFFYMISNGTSSDDGSVSCISPVRGFRSYS